MKRILRNYLSFLLPLVAFGVLFALPAHAQNAHLKKLVGDWELSKQNESNEKRTISFTNNNRQITGEYVDADGERKTTTPVQFANGAYSFRIIEFNLVFRKLKFVNGKLVGEMVDTAVKGRVVPELISMSKKGS